MTLQDAQQAVFFPLQIGHPTMDTCRAYWLRMTLAASSLPPGGWILTVPADWTQADLYYSRGGEWMALRSGSGIPPRLRALPSSLILFPLVLQEGYPATFYVHLAGDTSRYGEARNFEATITRLDTVQRIQRSTLFAQGLYGGIIVALVLYNLILFGALGERTYLYYSLYVLTFGAIWTERTGILFEYLWPRSPAIESEAQFYLVVAAIVFCSLFVRHFLSTRERSRAVDRALLTLIACTLTLAVLRIAGVRGAATFLLSLTGLVTTLFFATVGVLFLIRGYRPARFFLVAFALQLIGNALYIFAFLRLIPFNFLTHNSAQIGSAAGSILLAFALADRVNLFKQEQEQKQSRYTRDLQVQVKQRTQELTRAVEKLRAVSVTDPLTGLSNRRHVDAAIQPWIAEIQRERMRSPGEHPRRSLAICLSDLDHFKLINDQMGHGVGDQVLQSVAEILQQTVRATAILARWGGEEFLVLDHVIGAEDDLLMAERLRRAVVGQNHPSSLVTGRPLSLSLGLVRFPFSAAYPNLLNWDQCLGLADHALYRAKREGRNCWRSYRPDEQALSRVIQLQGMEEVRRLLRSAPESAVEMGLIQVVSVITSDVSVT